MNLVGKIFTVSVFIMSLVFMAFAIAVYANHRNYRVEILRAPTDVQAGQKKGLRFQIEDLNKQLKDLQTQKQQIETELTNEKRLRQQMVAMLEAEMVDVRLRRDFLISEELRLLKDRADAVLKMEASQATIVDLQNTIETLRKQVGDQQQARDTSFAKVVELEDKLAVALGDWERLRKRNEELAKDVARYPGSVAPAAARLPQGAARE